MKRLLCALVMVFGISTGDAGIQKVWAINGSERVHESDTAGTWNSVRPSDYGVTGPNASGMQTINLRTDARNTIWNTTPNTITLFGGKNEVVDFQLIIHGDASGATNVNVTLPSLVKSTAPTFTIQNTSTDPFAFKGRYIEMFVEHYQKLPKRSNEQYVWWSTGKPQPDKQYLYQSTDGGGVPEQLVPFEATAGAKTNGQGGAPFSIRAHKNQAVWVDIYIPRTAVAGDYSGTLTIKEGIVTRYSIPVALKVYDYTIPDTATIRTYVNGGPPSAWGYWNRYPNVDPGVEQYNLARLTAGMLFKHRIQLGLWCDTTTFKQQLDSIYSGKYFNSTIWDAPRMGSKPNVYQIGFYDWPNHWPGYGSSARGWQTYAGGNFYATKDRGQYALGVAYAVNDVVHDDDYPYHYWCKSAHTSSIADSSQPTENPLTSTSAGYTKRWVKIYELDATSFIFHGDSTIHKTNIQTAMNSWKSWWETNNPSARLYKYFAEEMGIEGGNTDTGIYADTRRKIRWFKTNPGKYVGVRFAGSMVEPGLIPFNLSIGSGDAFFVSNGQAPTYSGLRVDSIPVYIARGVSVGTYGGCMPQAPAEVIDAPGSHWRARLWLLKKYGFQEHMVDDATGSGTSTVNTFYHEWYQTGDTELKGNAGDPTLFYPGSMEGTHAGDSRGLRGPIMGIRAKNYRRGIQDWEMLTMAAARGIPTSGIINNVVVKAYDKMGVTLNPTTDTAIANTTWKQRGWDYESARLSLALALAGTTPTPPPTGTFFINDKERDTLSVGGETVTLSWTSNDATSAEIDQGIGSVAVTGSRSFDVESTMTFTLTLTNATASIRKTVYAFVTPGPRALGSIAVSDDTLQQGGGTIYVSWGGVTEGGGIQYADSQHIIWPDGDSTSVAAQGTIAYTLYPKGNFVFLLRMYDYAGTVEKYDTTFVKPYRYIFPGIRR